jgi:type I site-specific restriction endonuclease
MIKKMTYIAEHLSNLRQEITDLRNLNAKYSNKSEHGPVDQSALEIRTNRLREIKQELSTMLERPTDPKVWWERLRKPDPRA